MCQVPVILENDANLACLAEAAIGAGKGYSHVQFLTISTGIGTGLAIDKQLFHGARALPKKLRIVSFGKMDLRKGI